METGSHEWKELDLVTLAQRKLGKKKMDAFGKWEFFHLMYTST